MIQYTRTYTRPSISVPWWFEVQLNVPISTFRTRMNTAYYATGKVLSENVTVSPDGLSWTWTGLWESEAAFLEYDADATLGSYWTVKDEYNTANGIIKGPLEFHTI